MGCLVRITDRKLLCIGAKGENYREHTQSMRWGNNRKPSPGHAEAEMLVRSVLLFQVLELLSASYCLCPLSSRFDVFPSLPCLCYLCLCLCLVSNNKGTSPHRLSFPDLSPLKPIPPLVTKGLRHPKTIQRLPYLIPRLLLVNPGCSLRFSQTLRKQWVELEVHSRGNSPSQL